MNMFEPMAAEYLSARGIECASAEANLISALASDDVRQRTGKDWPALEIPYLDPHTGQPRQSRLRFLGDPLPLDADGKPQRYHQGKGTQNLLYFPAHPDLAAILKDPSHPIDITEGEFKAIRATQDGIYTMAVAGVWNWRSRDKSDKTDQAQSSQSRPIPDLDLIQWQGRDVRLVFDADFASNESVLKAIKAFGAELTNRHAKVSIVDLPGPEKGIDDYLQKHGLDAYQKLRTEAKLYREWIDSCKPKKLETQGSDEKESTDAFSQLMQIALSEAECWISSDDTVYADVVMDGIRKTFPIEGRHFKRWLATRMYELHQKGVSSEAIEKVLNVLCGMTSCKGTQREAHLRIAEYEGSIYIDMADERWQVIEVSKHGWRVIQSVDCPVRFVRAASQLPLPMPEYGGDPSHIWRLLPVAPDSRPLLLGWLISCFTTTGAKPILVFSGPKGSGKSEAATTLKMLTDPGKAAMMPSVGDSRNMASAAMSRWLMIYDNLTHLNTEQQDALCRASTGAGFSHRSLFTDLDETFTEYKRPQILTSVDLVPSRSDLLDRCVLVQLERIPDAYRIPLHQLERERAELLPKILGSLLSALAGGLQRVGSLNLERLPRMADFALMATACEPGLGLQDGEFMRAYQANIETAVETAVECNPIAAAILALMEDCTQWQGSTQQLLQEMKQKSSSLKVLKLEPKWLGRNLAGSLKADLDAVGIEVDDYKTNKGKQWIIRKLTHPPKVAEITSLSSLSSQPPQDKALSGDEKGDEKNQPENHVTFSSPPKPAQGKDSDESDESDEKKQTLRSLCDEDVDPYPVGCWIEFSRTGSKPKTAQVIPKPDDWTGSDEAGVFVQDHDGEPLLVPIKRIRKRVDGRA